MVHPRVASVREVPDLQKGLGEVRLGQQATSGSDRRPAEIGAGLHVEDLDHERVTRLRAADLDGTGERVPAEWPASQHVFVGRGPGVETIGGVARLEDDGVAGVDFDPRCERVVPLLVNDIVVEMARLHAASSFHATMPVPERQATAGM